MALVKQNYLNNKDMLLEIHRSKNSFSSFTQPEYHRYDIILSSLDDINDETIEQAKRQHAKRHTDEIFNFKKNDGEKIKIAECEFDIAQIKDSDLIFRIMTFDHIPKNCIRKKTIRTVADGYDKVNFPPFQHWKFNDNRELICVGKSHWNGPVDTGHFDRDHGNISNNLASMMIKLCERYSTRGNVRNYCVDTETQALTKRGWLGIDEINEEDTILSYSDGNLKWSRIKSIYRGEFDGLMHKITTKTGIDMLVTPEHKLVTPNGLVKIELLREDEKIILLGNPVQDDKINYSDAFVELAGWFVTEGSYRLYKDKISNIALWPNEGPHADRIRNCLNQLGYQFSESSKLQYTNKFNVCFSICSKDSREFAKVLPQKDLNMEFILALTTAQRELLLETMIDGDGRRVGKLKRYVQTSKNHIDLFQILCTLVGHRSTTHFVENLISFGKLTNYYNVNVFSKRKNQTNTSCLNFHGGKRNGIDHIGTGKINHPNVPTTLYKGMVWCPETEYGCFVARRNGTIYLTSNTYNDEMKCQAILQLTQVGLQFDESKSDNPFGYFSQVVTNSFLRILNIEKKNQNIRDDILELNGMNPSYTRLHNSEYEYEMKRNSYDD